jgi:GNAT superfamily N-acetyltransferase
MKAGFSGSGIEIKNFNENLLEDIVKIYNTGTVFTPYCAPLSADLLKNSILSRDNFDPEGFFAGYKYGEPAGFIHAGYASAHFKEKKIGSIYLFMSEERDVSQALLERAIGYFRSRGTAFIRCFFSNCEFYAGIYMGTEVVCWTGFYNIINTLEKNGFETTLHGFIMRKDMDEPPEVLSPEQGIILRVEPSQDCPGLYTNTTVKAFDNEKEIGHCEFHILKPISAHLGKIIGQLGIAVDSAYRKKKIGSALLSKAHSEMYKMGARRVILATNYALYPALQMYLKFGYSKELIDIKGFHLELKD